VRIRSEDRLALRARTRPGPCHFAWRERCQLTRVRRSLASPGRVGHDLVPARRSAVL